MVINLTDLRAIMEREIMSRFDHRDLNADTDYFEKVPPTPENLALVIYRILRDTVPDGLLDRIRLHSDGDSFVDVAGPIE
jgi:6-pyruvoyltetrahydropterin/6-carboxytetrahydropterin synthase